MAISDNCCGFWPQRTLAITIFSGQRPYHLKFTETLFVCVDRYCLLWPDATAAEKSLNIDNLVIIVSFISVRLHIPLYENIYIIGQPAPG